jgi:hypothetical protein
MIIKVTDVQPKLPPIIKINNTNKKPQMGFFSY